MMDARARGVDAQTATTQLIDMLAQSAFMTMGVLTRLSAENGLSLTQLRVLAILRDRRPRMSELAVYLGLEKSTLTGLVARAEKRGLIARSASATDGRAVDVFLTDRGMGLAEQLTGELTDLLAPLATALSPVERTQLESLLARMLDLRQV